MLLAVAIALFSLYCYGASAQCSQYYHSCENCAAQSSCGWLVACMLSCRRYRCCGRCASTGICLTGSTSGPYSSNCANWDWTSYQCPPDNSYLATYGTIVSVIGIFIVLSIIVCIVGCCMCQSQQQQLQQQQQHQPMVKQRPSVSSRLDLTGSY